MSWLDHSKDNDQVTLPYDTFEGCHATLMGVESIDFFLASQICQEYRTSDSLFFHCIIALNMFMRQGDSCLALAKIAHKNPFKGTESVKFEVLSANVREKPGYEFCGEQALEACLEQVINASTESSALLVLSAKKLFLMRYWRYESEIAELLMPRMNYSTLQAPELSVAEAGLTVCYPHRNALPDKQEINWSKVAVANALGRQFSVITGGPGTGKTYTATRLLYVVQALFKSRCRILLAAPTGKAAQRLKESIIKGKAELLEAGAEPQFVEAIPENTQTLHRLLGFRPRQLTPKFNKEKKLQCDLLLVDEVSMIDLPMMAKLLRAVPDSAKLVFLGDAQQLPSVDIGDIMADLQKFASSSYSQAAADDIYRLTGERVPVSQGYDFLTCLVKSWRFGGEIGELSKMIINGDAEESWLVLQSFREPGSYVHGDQASQQKRELAWVSDQRDDRSNLPVWFRSATRHYYHSVVNAVSVQAAFYALSQFRILSPTRVGPTGIIALNEAIESYLSGAVSSVVPGKFYKGRPIMVVENNYGVQLFNGDVGIVWTNTEGRLAAFFENGKDESNNPILREVSLARLPAVETVYAMTIHKTQGSEFNHVAIVLPDQDSEMLSRQLLYTGITRARDFVYVLSSEKVWKQAVQRSNQRQSGLAEKLLSHSVKAD